MMVNSCVKSFTQIKEMLRQFLGWMRIAPALASECSCPWCLAGSCWRHKTRPQQKLQQIQSRGSCWRCGRWASRTWRCPMGSSRTDLRGSPRCSWNEVYSSSLKSSTRVGGRQQTWQHRRLYDGFSRREGHRALRPQSAPTYLSPL